LSFSYIWLSTIVVKKAGVGLGPGEYGRNSRCSGLGVTIQAALPEAIHLFGGSPISDLYFPTARTQAFSAVRTLRCMLHTFPRPPSTPAPFPASALVFSPRQALDLIHSCEQEEEEKVLLSVTFSEESSEAPILTGKLWATTHLNDHDAPFARAHLARGVLPYCRSYNVASVLHSTLTRHAAHAQVCRAAPVLKRT